VKWSRWLADTLPGTRKRVELRTPESSSPRNDGRNTGGAHWQPVLSRHGLHGATAFVRSPVEVIHVEFLREAKYSIPATCADTVVLFNIWDVGSAKAVEGAGARGACNGECRLESERLRRR